MINKIAYLECPTGIAGDMCLGALVDLGLPLSYLIEGLKGLGIDSEYRLEVEKVHRRGQLATKVHVILSNQLPVTSYQLDSPHTVLEKNAKEHNHDHHHYSPARHLPEIENIINQGKLPPRVKNWSLAIFNQLAIAEGAVHGLPPEQVHFHEVGATDAIVDIVGTCLGLDWFNITQVYCSALPTGGGTVKAAHGQLPVPVPAVLKLWESRQVPIYDNGLHHELVTPTGAAIAVTLATGFGKPPAMTLEKVGLGAGSKDLAIPNMLRLWLGTKITDLSVNKQDVTPDIVAVLETQIDDLTPQAIAYTCEELLKIGAVDVFTQAIGMKKSRPGILLTVICPLEQQLKCEEIIFRETTTLGIRCQVQSRSILAREIEQVETAYGIVRVKVASKNEAIVNIQPEYEDCAAIARQHQIPLLEVQQLALKQFQVTDGDESL